MNSQRSSVIPMFLYVCGLATAACAAPATTQPADALDNPHLWKPKVHSVAVFKNGYGFFMRSSKVNLRDGWCVAEKVPAATFGTLAIYSAKEGELVDIVGSGPGEIVDFDGVDQPRDAAVKRKRLAACKNLKISLTYDHKGAARHAEGYVVSVGPEYVVLENGDQSFAVPVAGVKRLQVRQMPLRVHVSAQNEKSPQETELGMAYLRKGITWIPEYTMRILDDTTAELTLRGTVVNEAEDIIHGEVNFVVGVPHFLHTDYLTPIAVGQTIRAVSSSVAPSQIRSQIMSRAAIVSNAITADQFDIVPMEGEDAGAKVDALMGNLPKFEGPGGTDYTVYTKEDLTIRRGERAIVTLFVKRVKYTHVYRWSPPERLRHFLVVLNDTDTAWTTGPVLALSGHRPLSEDLLRYTPKQGRCEIPVTVAVNISHDRIETEVERKLKAYSPKSHVVYDLVKLEGTLYLHNFERKPVEVAINARVEGKPLSASDKGEMTVDTSRLKLRERRGNVRWHVTLQPGERRTFTYTYERYVPSD